MKRALVTGGAGFIGSHLVEALIKDGYEVAVIDDLSTGSLDNLPPKGIRLFKGSVSDAELVREAFSSHKPDYVFHLAAQISVSRSVREPAFDADINIVGSIRIMEECVREAVKKIIYTSSGGVMYGENPPVLPTPETSPCAPFSPYGIAKLTGEKYLAFFRERTRAQMDFLKVRECLWSSAKPPRRSRRRRDFFAKDVARPTGYDQWGWRIHSRLCLRSRHRTRQPSGDRSGGWPGFEYRDGIGSLRQSTVRSVARPNPLSARGVSRPGPTGRPKEERAR